MLNQTFPPIPAKLLIHLLISPVPFQHISNHLGLRIDVFETLNVLVSSCFLDPSILQIVLGIIARRLKVRAPLFPQRHLNPQQLTFIAPSLCERGVVHDRFVVVVAVGVELVLEPVSVVDEAGGILVV
jgi:hypothetical protein